MADAAGTSACPFCGAEVIRGSDACDSCGRELGTTDLPETAAGFSESDLSEPISAIRLMRPPAVAPEATIREAVAAAAADAGGAVVVVAPSGRVVGVLTERDVLRRVAGADILDAPVSTVMTADVIVLRDDDTMATALHKMGVGGFRHVPLVREGELVGMVTDRQILSWLMSRWLE
jgi:CBS domain-containing protein